MKYYSPVQAGEQAAVSGARPDVVNRLDAVKAAIQSLNTLLARTRRPVRVAIAAEDQWWPEFMSASRDGGVHATLSIPLIVAAESPQDADELVGSVNAYSRRTASFDLVDEKLLSLYTDAASQAIASSRRRHG